MGDQLIRAMGVEVRPSLWVLEIRKKRRGRGGRSRELIHLASLTRFWPPWQRDNE